MIRSPTTVAALAALTFAAAGAQTVRPEQATAFETAVMQAVTD